MVEEVGKYVQPEIAVITVLPSALAFVGRSIQGLVRKVTQGDVPAGGLSITFANVRGFWAAARNRGPTHPNSLRAGAIVTVSGTLSLYGPMIVGDPRLKREKHLEYRSKLLEVEQSGDDSALTANPTISLTSGNTVWRFAPASDLYYLGLYQGIVRNCIPVVANQGFFDERIRPLFAAPPFEPRDQLSSYFVEVELTGELRNIDPIFLDAGVRREAVPGVTTWALYLGPDTTDVRGIGVPGFVDGDIWVGLEHRGQGRLLTRFLDLADPDDFQLECKKLAEDLRAYGQDVEVVAEFDEVERLLGVPYTRKVSLPDLLQSYPI